MINKQRNLKIASLVSISVLLGACSTQAVPPSGSVDIQPSANITPATIAVVPAPQVTVPVITTEVPAATRPATSGNAGTANSYLVKKGDTVYEVMRQTGVYWKDIISMNNLQAPSYTIQPGQTLRIR